MTKNVNYSLQLNDIPAPPQSGAGELLRRAGQIEGQVNAQAGADTASAISFLGTTAIGAVKGKMEADLDSEINDATSRLEGYGDVALRSAANLRNVQDDIASFADNPPGEPEHIKQFGDEVSRFITASRQGVLSRAEVVTRIGAAVKKYSAMAPGFATDFRRLAAERTGISHADIYGLHTALTTKSMAEKAAEKQMELQMALDKEIASENGVGMHQITPDMRAFHFANKQLKIASERATQQMNMTNLTRGEADRAWGQIYSMKLGEAATEIARDLATAAALNSDPTKAAESSQFGLQFAAKVGMLTASMERDIAEMARPMPGRTPLSLEAQNRMLTEWRAVAKNWQEASKEIEGRNFMAAAVKNAQQNVELLVSNFKIANPHLTVLNTYGSVSELVKAWFALGNKEEFNKRFSPQLGAAMEKVMQAPQFHANLMGQAFGGAGINLPQVAQLSPELAQVVASDMVASIKEWSKDPNPTPQRKDVFANTFASFYSDAANFNPGVRRNLDAAYTTLSNPETQRFFSQLSSEQRSRALLPMLARMERAYFDVGMQIREELTKWNDPDANNAARAGINLALGRNRLTGAFEIVEERTAPAKASVASNPAGAAVGFANQGTAASRVDANAARVRATELTGTLNRMLETYTLGVRSLGLEGANNNLSMVQEFAEMGIRAGKPEPLTPGLVGPQAAATQAPAVPKNTPTVPPTFDENRYADAIKVAEGSGVNATSPKGAAGEYQFMPETAKRFGLKLDPKAGIDERRDSPKARAAAIAYGKELASMFGGDMEKVAAAYNAGEGNVQAAVKKATELGVPDHWRAFLPKPKETVPYIERFMKAYGRTQPIRVAASQ